jgi:hypothetical protein
LSAGDPLAFERISGLEGPYLKQTSDRRDPSTPWKVRCAQFPLPSG